MRKLAQVAMALACAHAGSSPAAAWSVDAERGNGVQLAGLGTTVLDRRDVRPDSAWVVDRMWIARAAYWNAEHPQPFGKHLWDVSLVPTLRIAARDGAVQPFVEAGIGAHLLSTTHIDNRRLSTAFQFGEQLAVGLRLPGSLPLTVSLRAEHVSNGGIKEPNPGVTFAGMRVQLDWP